MGAHRAGRREGTRERSSRTSGAYPQAPRRFCCRWRARCRVDPRLRASDADRERTAQLLREHHAVGRLTAEEFNDRLEKTFAARTLGELDELLADLPAIDLYQLPSAGIRPAPPGTVRRRGTASAPSPRRFSPPPPRRSTVPGGAGRMPAEGS